MGPVDKVIVRGEDWSIATSCSAVTVSRIVRSSVAPILYVLFCVQAENSGPAVWILCEVLRKSRVHRDINETKSSNGDRLSFVEDRN